MPNADTRNDGPDDRVIAVEAGIGDDDYRGFRACGIVDATDMRRFTDAGTPGHRLNAIKVLTGIVGIDEHRWAWRSDPAVAATINSALPELTFEDLQVADAAGATAEDLSGYGTVGLDRALVEAGRAAGIARRRDFDRILLAGCDAADIATAADGGLTGHDLVEALVTLSSRSHEGLVQR